MQRNSSTHNQEAQKLISQYKSLQGRLNASEQIRRQLQERQQQLKEQFEKLGMVKHFKQFKKQVYYYQAQIKEYKAVFEDPTKFETALINALSAIPEFKDYFGRNSVASTLPGLRPDLPGLSLGRAESYFGLQSRVSVQQVLQQRLNVQNNGAALRSRFTEALQTYSNFKEAVEKHGNASGKSLGFKPNSQKVKSFRDRLTYNYNISFSRSSRLFPTSGNMGFHLGYRCNDFFIAGIGVGYRLGLGRGWDHIKFTSEGLGIRSFFEYKATKGFNLNAGLELNYLGWNKTIQRTTDSIWQRSLLMGFSKKVRLGNGLNGSVTVLYDFLYNRYSPNSSRIVYRFGYNF